MTLQPLESTLADKIAAMLLNDDWLVKIRDNFGRYSVLLKETSCQMLGGFIFEYQPSHTNSA